MTDRAAKDLLREMRSPVVPVEAPEIVVARRDRVISRLRDAQLRQLANAQTKSSWRRRLAIAALVCLPSGALAATWMVMSSSGASARMAARGAPAAPSPAARATAAPVHSENLEAAAFSGREEPRAAVQEEPGERPSPSVGRPFPRSRALRTTASRASSLAAENALMQAALAAGRRGDESRAVTLLGELLARYPDSPLAQNAEVERFRALHRRGDVSAATRLARRYLGDHPDGMARDEARRLAVEEPASSGSFPP